MPTFFLFFDHIDGCAAVPCDLASVSQSHEDVICVVVHGAIYHGVTNIQRVSSHDAAMAMMQTRRTT